MSRWSLLAAIALWCATASVAEAQPRARDVGEARELFDDAMRAMDEDSFDVAIELFERSLALAPRPATAFNLALALRGAGRLRHAIARLDALLAGELGELRPSQRREAEALRTEAAADLATIRITARGAPGIELRVDGERVEPASDGAAEVQGAEVQRAEVQRAEVQVDPGDHLVTASAPDHATVERSVTVARRGASEVELELQPRVDTRPGRLVLESTDPSLVVEIVGVASATGRLERELPPGLYDVRVTSHDGRRDSRIEVPPGRSVRLALEPPVASRTIAEEPWLWITIGAVVLVGGGVAIGAGIAASEARQAPFSDPVFGVVETLTW